MPRSVAIVLEQLLAPVPGGTGRYSAGLARALAATAPVDASVEGWVAWHRDLEPARVAGVGEPHRLAMGRRGLAALWERGVGPRPRGADLVHAPTVLAPPRGRRPLVVTVHDAVPWTHPETLTSRGVAFHRRMVGMAARSADAVVVPSHAAGDDLVAAVPALRDRLVVVPPGLSGSLGLPEDAAARRARLALPAAGFLLTVSTVEPRKGLDVLLRALARPGLADLQLLVVGPAGWGSVDVPGLAREAGLERRVRLLGRVPDEDLAVLYAAATALVVPSRSEGFGLPALEAMALGVPLLISDAPALVEVADGAAVVTRAGDVASLADGVLHLLDDAEGRERRRARGLARAEDFSWERSAAGLWRLYDGLA